MSKSKKKLRLLTELLKWKNRRRSIKRNKRTLKLLNITRWESRKKNKLLSKLKESETRRREKFNVFVSSRRRQLIDRAKSMHWEPNVLMKRARDKLDRPKRTGFLRLKSRLLSLTKLVRSSSWRTRSSWLSRQRPSAMRSWRSSRSKRTKKRTREESRLRNNLLSVTMLVPLGKKNTIS